MYTLTCVTLLCYITLRYGLLLYVKTAVKVFIFHYNSFILTLFN